ncbi:hypothetical protein DJ564_13820 [Pseudomonas sp. 31-12]|nr:hypothetical protein DJ564_13820 [Pseudomonas sp. 31-12]
MGASLLAIASSASTKMLTDRPLSRAGSLPQGGCVSLGNRVRSGKSDPVRNRAPTAPHQAHCCPLQAQTHAG